MKIYRGVTKLLFKQIDPYFKGSGAFNSFGKGTSYAVDYKVAKIYAEGCQPQDDIFAYILEYEASNINFFTVNPENFMEQSDDDFDEDGFYILNIDNNIIRSNKLSPLIKKNGYNAALINESYEISTGKQLLILDDSINLELNSIHFVINYPLGNMFDDAFKKLNLKKIDDNIYDVPYSKIDQLDILLSEYCF